MLSSLSRSPIIGTSVLRQRPLPPPFSSGPKPCHKAHLAPSEPAARAQGNRNFRAFPQVADVPVRPLHDAALGNQPDEADSLYLFACFAKWEQEEEPSAAWELLAAAQSSHADTRAHARALLSSSRHLAVKTPSAHDAMTGQTASYAEVDMNSSYGLEIVQKCSECSAAANAFFCKFSQPMVETLDEVTHKSTLPSGAVLFVEGQSPRGMFVVCSGRVNLSTTSREGKLLLLKTAEAGEVVGLSATLSGLGYEVTAETATACQVSFIDRNHVLDLMQTHAEFSLQSAEFLSRGFHEAYRDLRDLMLSKTSAGKLARLLLSQSSSPDLHLRETRIPSTMTHEEMAHRIGASRETVTRLLSALKKKHLICQDGSALVIRDRTALEALTV